MGTTCFAPRFISLGKPCALQGVTKPGEVRKIKGEGMPIQDSSKKGDLLVKFSIEFPKSLDDEQKEEVKKLFAEATWEL